VLGQIRVLEEDDVVVRAGGGDRVPHTPERVLQILGLQRDFEDADVVGLAHLRLGQRRGQLGTGLLVPGRADVQRQHRDDLPFSHDAGLATSSPRQTHVRQVLRGARPAH
jgi:hypothetical protein